MSRAALPLVLLATLTLLGACREELCSRTLRATCTCELPLELVHCSTSIEWTGCERQAPDVDVCQLNPCCYPLVVRDAGADAPIPDAAADNLSSRDLTCADSQCVLNSSTDAVHDASTDARLDASSPDGPHLDASLPRG